jgi:thymidylate synthase
MRDYHLMIDEVLDYGTRKENRTGVDTISTFNYNYELTWDQRLKGSRTTYVGDPVDGNPRVPLLTTKDVSWKNIVVEMLWFLSGDPSIKILQRHGCKFWDAWADKDGLVPMAYGQQWRRFPVHKNGEVSYNDQIEYIIKGLRKSPMNRRLVVSAWAPEEAQVAALPPCHMLFAFNVQNVLVPGGDATGEFVSEPRLCLHLTQRSCDLALGVPYNMASYGLLLLIMSHLTGIKPGIFAHTLLDLHIYTSKPDDSMAEYDHVPGLLEQRKREPKDLPTLEIDPRTKELSDIEDLMDSEVSTETILSKFKLHDYDPHPAIKFKVAV